MGQGVVIELNTVDDFILSAAAFLVALTVIIVSAVKAHRLLARIDDAIGVGSDGQTLASRLERVEHQVFPNGGGSLADEVADLKMQAAAQTASLSVIKELLIKKG